MNDNKDSERNQIEKTTETERNQLDLSGVGPIDVSKVDPEMRKEIEAKRMENYVELEKKAIQADIDNRVAKERLDNMTSASVAAKKDEISATLSQTIKDESGTLTILTGTSDAAQKGKMSATQEGRTDMKFWYFIGGAIFLLILASIFAGNG